MNIIQVAQPSKMMVFLQFDRVITIIRINRKYTAIRKQRRWSNDTYILIKYPSRIHRCVFWCYSCSGRSGFYHPPPLHYFTCTCSFTLSSLHKMWRSYLVWEPIPPTPDTSIWTNMVMLQSINMIRYNSQHGQAVYTFLKQWNEYLQQDPSWSIRYIIPFLVW